MLPSLEAAYCQNGPYKKAIAAACGIGASQVYNWMHGHRPIPKHRRQKFERALGAKVDWEQYSREIAALTRENSPSGGKPDELPPRPPETPQKPPQGLTGWFSDILVMQDD